MRALAKICAGVVLAGVAVGVPAMAQPSSDKLTTYPTCMGRSPKPEEGNAAYLLGKKRYDARDFDKALEFFMEAYTADCNKHDYLIIISRTHELMAAKGETVRHLKESLRALEIYYERIKQEPDEENKKRLEALRADIRSAQDKAAAASASASASAAPTTTSTAPPPKAEGGHTPWPWIPVGVGGAGVVAGAILLPVGLLNMPKGCTAFSGTCTPTPNGPPVSDKDRSDAGKAQGLIIGGLVTIGAGIVVAAGGLVWHFLEPTEAPASTSSRKPIIVPSVGAGYAGVDVGGRF